MTLSISKRRTLRRNFTSGFGLADVPLPNVTILHQQTKFRSYSSVYVWLIPKSGLEKQTSAILELYIALPVSISTTWAYQYSTCHFASGCQISSKSDHPQRRYDVISIFKVAAAADQFHFRFRIGWRRSLEKVHMYQQTKFRSYSSIHIWVITISGLEKQMSAILEFHFRFLFRPYHRTWHVTLH